MTNRYDDEARHIVGILDRYKRKVAILTFFAVFFVTVGVLRFIKIIF